jgi:hypothetical protein
LIYLCVEVFYDIFLRTIIRVAHRGSLIKVIKVMFTYASAFKKAD